MNTPDYAQEDLSVSKEMRRGREPSDDSSSASPSFSAKRAFAAVAAASSLSSSATLFSRGSTNAARLSTAKMRAWMFANSKSMPDDSSSEAGGSGDDDSASLPKDSDRDRLRWYSCNVEPKLADMRSSSSSSLLDSDAGAVRARATKDDAAVASTLTGRDELREEGALVVPEAVRFLSK